MTIRAREQHVDHDLHDPVLEDREVRKDAISDCEASTGLKVGMMSVSIEPGDELGELFINTQYEAVPGEHDACQRGQNQLLLDGSAWLRELLEKISQPLVDWDVEIYPVPCQQTRVPVPVERAIDVVNGTRVQTQVGPRPEVGPENTVEPR
jgi:hypothetical protein